MIYFIQDLNLLICRFSFLCNLELTDPCSNPVLKEPAELVPSAETTTMELKLVQQNQSVADSGGGAGGATAPLRASLVEKAR